MIVNRDKDHERLRGLRRKETKSVAEWRDSRAGSTWQSFTHTTACEREEKGIMEGEEEDERRERRRMRGGGEDGERRGRRRGGMVRGGGSR